MEDRVSRKRAIRLKCLDCCCGNSAEVRKCTAEKCPLWCFRMGTVPRAEKGTKIAPKTDE